MAASVNGSFAELNEPQSFTATEAQPLTAEQMNAAEPESFLQGRAFTPDTDADADADTDTDTDTAAPTAGGSVVRVGSHVPGAR